METEDTVFGIGMSALSQIRGKTVRAAGDAEGVEKFQNIINRSAEAGDKQALYDFDEPIEIMDEFLDEDGELLDKALVDKAVSFINRNFSKDFDKKPSNKVIDDFIHRLEDGDPELNEFVLDDNINNLRDVLDAYRAFNYKDEVSGGMSPSDASSELRSLWDEVTQIGELIAPTSNFIKVHDVVARAGTVADEVAEVAAEPAARSADEPVARQAGETNDEIKSEIQQEYENIRTKMDHKLFAKGDLDFPQSP